ncbi:thioredoxin family protein [Ideonella sp. 4Y11]|uniref:Thioredoxin family protein n=1 Tax=Ideonella aquatica TaxID=2824119 RepID=A0A940YRJ1_9BURK|nr:thioredoxin family protein [Ideonella aquatica]MBQ0960668.1 thioredoxin family protein [Ideonella aquatica]
MNQQRRHWLQATGLGLLPWTAPARAAIPAAYAPMVIEPAKPQGDAGPWQFDLRPAQARARQLKKDIYLVLTATDCHYCHRYEAFLAANAQALVPHFNQRWMVATMTAQLAVDAKRLHLRTEAHQGLYADFQRAIGDQRARLLVYPCVWVLSADGKPLMQMPAGAGTFETVPEQLEILRLEE